MDAYIFIVWKVQDEELIVIIRGLVLHNRPLSSLRTVHLDNIRLRPVDLDAFFSPPSLVQPQHNSPIFGRCTACQKSLYAGMIGFPARQMFSSAVVCSNAELRAQPYLPKNSSATPPARSNPRSLPSSTAFGQASLTQPCMDSFLRATSERTFECGCGICPSISSTRSQHSSPPPLKQKRLAPLR